jgi:hypothetical protein
MIDILLPAILVVGIAILAVTVYVLRSSRRLEDLGVDRYELLHEQHDQMELLREERRMLREELERESQERQKLLEYLQQVLGADANQVLIEEIEQERQERMKSEHQVQRREQDRLRLEQEYDQLEKKLEQERQGRMEAQQRADRLEREHAERLKTVQQEAVLQLEQERLEAQQRLEQEQGASRPLWRRPFMAAVLLLGVFVAWITSLLVALNLLYS